MIARTFREAQTQTGQRRTELTGQKERLEARLADLKRTIGRLAQSDGNGGAMAAELAKLNEEYGQVQNQVDDTTHELAALGADGPTEDDVRDALQKLEPLWDELFPAEKERIIKLLVHEVVVKKDGLLIRLRLHGLNSLVAELVGDGPVELGADGQTVDVRVPMEFKMRAGRREIILPADAETAPRVEPNQPLVLALARAHRWQRMLDTGEVKSLDELAERYGVDRSYIGRIPMHPQLAEELTRRLEEQPALPQAKVFPTVVTDVTRLKDFLRADLARKEVVTDAEGKPVMVGKGKWQRPKTKIVTEDAEGRVVDLHAMRTTLGTNLAKAGVAPQLAQRIMRHGDYRTTLKHYTVLGLVDTAKAINTLPSIETPQADALAATGTTGRDDPGTVNRHTVTKTPQTVTAVNQRHVKGLYSGRDGHDGCDGLSLSSAEADATFSKVAGDEAVEPTDTGVGSPSGGSATGSSRGTKRCDTLRHVAMAGDAQENQDNRSEAHKPCGVAALCDNLRDVAIACEIAGEGIRTLDVQLGKLAFYH